MWRTCTENMPLSATLPEPSAMYRRYSSLSSPFSAHSACSLASSSAAICVKHISRKFNEMHGYDVAHAKVRRHGKTTAAPI